MPAWGGRWTKVAVAAVVAIAAALRLLAARGDLWFDEIWSLHLLARLRSPFEILTFRHDNNHPLNSLFLWWLRDFHDDYVLRLPATLLGGIGVALAAWSASLADDDAPPSPAREANAPFRALLAAVLVGGSYLLVQYGSEARGYSAALTFALLAFALAQKGRLAPNSRWCWAYGAAVLLALSAHAVAVHVVAGVLVWSCARWWRHGLRGSALLRALAAWHALPLLGTTALYLGFLRHLFVGGGRVPDTLADTLARTVAYTGGLPLSFRPPVLLGLGGLTVVACLWWLWRCGSDQWSCYLVTIAVSPALLLTVHPGDLYFERYFLVSVSFALLLLARALGEWAARGRAQRVAAVLVTLTVVGAGAPRIARLLREQRGHYEAALQFMVDHGRPGPLTIGNDHLFRNGLVLTYYAERLGVLPRLTFVTQATPEQEGPDWLLFHRVDGEAPPEPLRQDPLGNVYQLQREHPSAPLSGFRWFLFRRVGRPTGTEN
jgi:hypothetical protein